MILSSTILYMCLLLRNSEAKTKPPVNKGPYIIYNLKPFVLAKSIPSPSTCCFHPHFKFNCYTFSLLNLAGRLVFEDSTNGTSSLGGFMVVVL